MLRLIFKESFLIVFIDNPKLEIVHGKCNRKSISYEGSCKSKDDVKLCAPAPFSLNNCDGKVNASLMEFRIFL